MRLLHWILCKWEWHDYVHPHEGEPTPKLADLTEWVYWFIRRNRMVCKHCGHQFYQSKQLEQRLEDFLP